MGECLETGIKARGANRQPRGIAAMRRNADPITVTISDTKHLTGLGGTKIYELISEGRLETVAIGRRRLVLYASIRDLLTPPT